MADLAKRTRHARLIARPRMGVVGGHDRHEGERGRSDQHQIDPVESRSPSASRAACDLIDRVFHDGLALCLRDGNAGLPGRPLCDIPRDIRVEATLIIIIPPAAAAHEVPRTSARWLK
jgi:hypothetical protein